MYSDSNGTPDAADTSHLEGAEHTAAAPLYREPFAAEPRRSLRERLNELAGRFSPAERALFYALAALMMGSVFALAVGLNNAVSTVVPARGGTHAEGVIGTARFVNPILAMSQADQDLAALVYSGLTRKSADGAHMPDIAQSFEISEDGTTYTFHLRPDARFHDGAPLTSADVLFTIRAAQNPEHRSPRRADWEGVSIAAPDEHTVVFTLPNPYAPFLENTELGILPRHLWESVSSEDFAFHALNTKPVGSGPFMVKNVITDSTGAPLRYELVPFKDFSLGQPLLKRLTIHLYPNEEALLAAFRTGVIQAFAAASPATLGSLNGSVGGSAVLEAPLTRVFGIFFNQSRSPVLADAAVRRALDTALDKEAIVDEVLGGYGTPLTGPIPPGLIGGLPLPPEALSKEERLEAAHEILRAGLWKRPDAATTTDESAEPRIWVKGEQPLSFSIATADVPELVRTAEAVAEAWRELGADVDVNIYNLAEFNTNIIRPREYSAVLFGGVVGRTLDLFAFWHSSQRNDPGLNLALYTSTRADRILAAARAENDREERQEMYREFSEVVGEDMPAVFLFSPTFVYVTRPDIHGVELSAVTTPSERFASVHRWYISTERVWNIFLRDEQGGLAQ
ncbi:hypothetical protein COU20_02735 [Candidatus Kaiserbacteria bacterium CG10_big_fil_rev_8_21_14_0_10_59_10]|uniref:Solute-binding protein family 5 domain-containing protein n=1 Tax=Candidatus Kaiserbacteria bacterium CG10_big_fil_rev_8_21_14_0_10_59_10 TaxID=1974612 RepID=A0A2H0U9H1_9BACT|nr:MAG: hypothetical protein COU20_02735 [Candidatus Kaiserbacteria bacterium CG10_big_fil_rev_8_21_14_0_10_59_10]